MQDNQRTYDIRVPSQQTKWLHDGRTHLAKSPQRNCSHIVMPYRGDPHLRGRLPTLGPCVPSLPQALACAAVMPSLLLDGTCTYKSGVRA